MASVVFMLKYFKLFGFSERFERRALVKMERAV